MAIICHSSSSFVCFFCLALSLSVRIVLSFFTRSCLKTKKANDTIDSVSHVILYLLLAEEKRKATQIEEKMKDRTRREQKRKDENRKEDNRRKNGIEETRSDGRPDPKQKKKYLIHVKMDDLIQENERLDP